MSFVCDSAQDALFDFLEGGLDPARAAGMALHLRACPRCARDYFELKLHWDGSVVAEPGDEACLRAIARRLPQLHARPARARKGAWTLAGALAAATALAAAAFLAGVMRSRPSAVPLETAAPASVQAPLPGAESEHVDSARSAPASAMWF